MPKLCEAHGFKRHPSGAIKA